MFLSCHVRTPVWPNGWVFVYELSGYEFESSCSHLTKKVLEERKHIEDYVMANDDKGGTVIKDVKDYSKEFERQLNDTKQHYRHLKHDPTIENKVLTRFKNDKLISSNVWDGLKVESPGALCFYIQQKIHEEESPGSHGVNS